jgi:hypothetical protein
MKITVNHIRTFLDGYSSHITHWAVAHTPFRTYKATDRQVEAMKNEARKKCRHFRNTFSQALYQAKALRKPEIYSPLLITTIEGASTSASPMHTIHFNFAIGNLPKCIDTNELKSVFKHCWVEKSGMSADKLWIRDANVSENIGWLHYITKEAEHGNTETWDFENTQIPHKALAMDLS